MPTTIVGEAYVNDNDTATVSADTGGNYIYTAYVRLNYRTGEWELEPFDKPKEAEIIWEV
jgi:hypothetical protein